jgi:hypothetical protein
MPRWTGSLPSPFISIIATVVHVISCQHGCVLSKETYSFLRHHLQVFPLAEKRFHKNSLPSQLSSGEKIVLNKRKTNYIHMPIQ